MHKEMTLQNNNKKKKTLSLEVCYKTNKRNDN